MAGDRCLKALRHFATREGEKDEPAPELNLCHDAGYMACLLTPFVDFIGSELSSGEFKEPEAAIPPFVPRYGDDAYEDAVLGLLDFRKALLTLEKSPDGAVLFNEMDLDADVWHLSHFIGSLYQFGTPRIIERENEFYVDG